MKVRKHKINTKNTGISYRHYLIEIYNLHFQENIKDLKNTWKGIKNIISLKSSNQISPNATIDNNVTLKNPITIANAFNKYFSTIALDIQPAIRYSKKQLLVSSHQQIVIPFLFHLLIVMEFLTSFLP